VSKESPRDASYRYRRPRSPFCSGDRFLRFRLPPTTSVPAVCSLSFTVSRAFSSTLSRPLTPLYRLLLLMPAASSTAHHRRRALWCPPANRTAPIWISTRCTRRAKSRFMWSPASAAPRSSARGECVSRNVRGMPLCRTPSGRAGKVCHVVCPFSAWAPSVSLRATPPPSVRNSIISDQICSFASSPLAVYPP
jgi:hypothetical protein